MDRESPELIEREMEQTRESLTAKVSLLENKVMGQLESATDTVQGTMDSVQETVQSVKSAVQETVDSVTESVKSSVESITEGVKETLDVSKHVDQHPWAMLGGAAAVGFVTGLLVFRRETSAGHVPAYTPMPFVGTAAPAVSHRTGWLNDIFDLAGREVKKLAEQVVAQASASLKKTVESRVPQLVEQVVPGGPLGHQGNGASRFASAGNR